MQQLVTYKRYDDKGHRLSLFGKDLGNGTMEIFKLTCHPKEVFKRKEARTIYNMHLATTSVDIDKHVTIIPILSGDSPYYTFQRYCKQNFYLKKVGIELNNGEIPLSATIKTYYKGFSKRGIKYVEITKLCKR